MTAPGLRVALLAAAAAALAAGVTGGLARIGALQAATSPAAFHGAIMVSGFLGTVISLERAVALGKPFAYVAPAAAALGTLALLAGLHAAAMVLWIAAPLGLFAASLAIVHRQPELHTALLAVAAVAWAVGNLAFATGAPAAIPWWYAFLVLTIAAERLEMTRLLPRRPHATRLFLAILALLLAGALACLLELAVAPALYGAALVALAAWLAAYDIARRTVRTHGFARYAAVGLLGGYVWLAVAGLAWAGGSQFRDAALHALGLGFVFSMILAHAPLIVPVVARVRMRYLPAFYAPLALLHASLLARLAGGAFDPAWRAIGGALNAAAIAAFAATLAYAIATRERRSHGTVSPPR